MKSTRGDPKKAGNAGAKSLKIGYRPIRELEPDPVNPRSHSKKQVRQIAPVVGRMVPAIGNYPRSSDAVPAHSDVRSAVSPLA